MHAEVPAHSASTPVRGVREDVTVGIDLAAQSKRTAAVEVRWTSPAPVARVICTALDNDELAAILEDVRWVGLDVPFGWPEAFVDALKAHRNRTARLAAFEQGAADGLRLRTTDVHVRDDCRSRNQTLPMGDPRRARVVPLSVSTDRIAAPALRWAEVLARHEERADLKVNRAGADGVLEVYPAAAMHRWGVLRDGYKSRASREKRRQAERLRAEILGNLQSAVGLEVPPEFHEACVSSDDVLDALVCALVARAVMVGEADDVPLCRTGRLSREGWIRLPRAGSLAGLRAAT